MSPYSATAGTPLRRPSRTWSSAALVSLAVLFGTAVSEPWRVGLLAVFLTLAAAKAGVRALLVLMLITAGISLAPVTGGERALLSGLGGANLEGVRLLAVLTAFTAIAAREPRVLTFERSVGVYPLFLAYAASSILWSSAHLAGLRLAFKLVYPFVAYLVTVEVIRLGHEKSLRIALATGALVASAVCLWLAAQTGIWSEVGFAGRYRGGIGYNLVGHFSAITALASYAWARQSQRWGWWVLCGFLVVQMIATGSRTAFIALGAGSLTYEITVRGWIRAAGLCAMGVLIWLMTPTLGSRTEMYTALSMGGSTDPVSAINLSGRLLIWRDVWSSMVAGSPLWGHGLGSTMPFLASRYETIRLVHNEFLRLAAETGQLGLAAFLVAYGTVLWRLVRLVKRGNQLGKDAALAIAGFVAFMFASVTENTFELFSAFAAFPWIFCGIAIAKSRDRLGLRPAGTDE